jgi:HipA-like C-terminal domain
MAQLKEIAPENRTGFMPKKINRFVQVIKKKDFIVDHDFSVGGDAPKNFIRVYEYGSAKRDDPASWLKYIAKTGHKWYPNESITELLLNNLGSALGLTMAKSKLAIISGQLRFLSEYFLSSPEYELVHGADIFADYVMDKVWVEDVEQKKLARKFFTFQFAEKAIQKAFPQNFSDLLHEFVKLLIFDAIVGNNDRHFYNWGIIKDITDTIPPKFSPIFDTARGLFWNQKE